MTAQLRYSSNRIIISWLSEMSLAKFLQRFEYRAVAKASQVYRSFSFLDLFCFKDFICRYPKTENPMM